MNRQIIFVLTRADRPQFLSFPGTDPRKHNGLSLDFGSGRERRTNGAEAFAMMCPTLLLRLLKKAARLEKTAS
jgi:hypothetical protein